MQVDHEVDKKQRDINFHQGKRNQDTQEKRSIDESARAIERKKQEVEKSK